MEGIKGLRMRAKEHHSLSHSLWQYCLLVFQPFSEKMSQSSVLKMGESEKKKEVTIHGMKIMIPRFDNSLLIEGYSKTLIGRCMNPDKQDMKFLLSMLPRIWKVEERVAGADLGLGRFQFDFDSEDDITEVLKMEPFHFDFWMLSVVRWEPIIDAKYPSAITFWVRVMGIPLHFWAPPTFTGIGAALGEVKEVDLDNGKVKVVIDGYKPLVFHTTVEFHSGKETVVHLSYDRLFGVCQI